MIDAEAMARAAHARGEHEIAAHWESLAKSDEHLTRWRAQLGNREVSADDQPTENQRHAAAVLAGHASSLERARSAYAEGKKRLYRADGEPRYAEKEMGERLAALQQEADGAIRTAALRAEQAIASLGQQLAALQHSDPLSSLTSAELTLVSLRRPFIQEDVARMTPQALLERVQALLSYGDRADRYLWHRYAAHLLADARRAAAGGGAGVFTDEQRLALGSALSALEPLVRGPGLAAQTKALEERLTQARSLRALSVAAHDEVHETREALLARKRETLGAMI
jgi:hypothetical protein